jgi:hypothetical protein
MALNERPVQDSTVPGLKYQNWDEFHSNTQEATLASIDILISDEKHQATSTENGASPGNGNVELPERIRINSNYVVQILRKIRGSNHSADGPIIMFRPFKTLVFFDQEIRLAATELERKAYRTTAAVQLTHLRYLIQFMDAHLHNRMAFLQSPECRTIFFSDVWLLYKPGDLVISRDLCQVYQVIRVETKRKIIVHNGKLVVEDDSVVIHCVCIDFDGQWLGPVLRKVAIKAWGFSKYVDSLELIPLAKAITEKKVLKESLIRRGRIFVEVAGVLPMHYDGFTLDSKVQVNGTIIIDFEEALRDEENFKTWRTTIEHSLSEARIFATVLDDADNEAHAALVYYSKHGNPHEDSYVDNVRYKTYIRSQSILHESGDRLQSIATCPRRLSQAPILTEEELLIMNYRVFGYILGTGTLLSSGNWGEVFTPALKRSSSLTNSRRI